MLDDLLRRAASDGRLTGLSLGKRRDGWQADARDARSVWRTGLDADPVAAIEKAVQQVAGAAPDVDVFS